MAKKTAARRKPTPAQTAVRFVGERLRQLREARGLSQEALAARAKVSAKFVGEVERSTSNVSVTVMWALVVDGLRMSMAEFFMATDEAVADDVATMAAIVGAQPPEARRQAIRVLRALFDE